MTKKKETCPYCGRKFVYLSRHKCKVKKRLEAAEEDTKTVSERRQERIEETKKVITRNLKKDEKEALKIIEKTGDIYFEDLMEKLDKTKAELDDILDVLTLKSMIKMNRELRYASWTKHIYSINHFEEELKVEKQKINTKKKDFLWNIFSRQPCFICPFTDKCNETNQAIFNPHHCPFLTKWIEIALAGDEYNVNFDEIEQAIQKES